MNSNATTIHTDARRQQQRRAQRKPAGDGGGNGLLQGMPSPAGSDTAAPQRDADGWLVSPPPANVLAAAALIGVRTSTGTELPGPNNALRDTMRWFEALDAAGAKKKEIERARCHMASVKPANGIIRWLRDHLVDRLEDQAARRDYEQALATEEAERPGRQLDGLRRRLSTQRREREKLEEQLRDKRLAEQRTEAVIDGLLEQYPHLQDSEERAA